MKYTGNYFPFIILSLLAYGLFFYFHEEPSIEADALSSTQQVDVRQEAIKKDPAITSKADQPTVLATQAGTVQPIEQVQPKPMQEVTLVPEKTEEQIKQERLDLAIAKHKQEMAAAKAAEQQAKQQAAKVQHQQSIKTHKATSDALLKEQILHDEIKAYEQAQSAKIARERALQKQLNKLKNSTAPAQPDSIASALPITEPAPVTTKSPAKIIPKQAQPEPPLQPKIQAKAKITRKSTPKEAPKNLPVVKEQPSTKPKTAHTAAEVKNSVSKTPAPSTPAEVKNSVSKAAATPSTPAATQETKPKKPKRVFKPKVNPLPSNEPSLPAPASNKATQSEDDSSEPDIIYEDEEEADIGIESSNNKLEKTEEKQQDTASNTKSEKSVANTEKNIANAEGSASKIENSPSELENKASELETSASKLENSTSELKSSVSESENKSVEEANTQVNEIEA